MKSIFFRCCVISNVIFPIIFSSFTNKINHPHNAIHSQIKFNLPKKISKYLTLIIVHRKKERKKTIIQTENTEVARYHTLLFLQRNEVFTWCTPFFVHTPCEIKIYDRAKHDYDDKSSRRESRSSADVYSRAEKVGRFGDVSTRRGI